jgi:hypothetical protein
MKNKFNFSQKKKKLQKSLRTLNFIFIGKIWRQDNNYFLFFRNDNRRGFDGEF